MASRATLREAQELKQELEIEYPDRKFGIDESKKKRQWNPAWGQPPGNMVIENGQEPDSKGYVTAVAKSYKVYEIRICKHGKEYHTTAIGEDHACDCEPHKRQAEPYRPGPDFEYDFPN